MESQRTLYGSCAGVLRAGIALAAATAACVQPTPTPTPTLPPPTSTSTVAMDCPSVSPALSAVNRAWPSPNPELAPTVTYVPNVVLVGGLTGAGVTDFDALVAGTSVAGQAFEEISFGDALTIRIYQIPQDVNGLPTVPEVIVELNGGGFPVFVEPDWLIGSPWPVVGSPWPVVGSPASAGITPAGLDERDLWGQWAFEQIGVSDRGAWASMGVRVAILDTSPFSAPGKYSFDFQGSGDFTLCVSHPDMLAEDWPQIDVLREHGTAIASLLRVTAPMSEIHLIRVLDSQAKGDLFALLRGLELVFRQAAMHEAPELDHTVVNLSLGYQAELGLPTAPEGARPPTPIEGLGPNCDRVGADLSLALCLALDVLGQGGATVVAAAGNNYHAPANLPGAWAHVLAVGATNADFGISCFSNDGEVWAPGGDGSYPDCKPVDDLPYRIVTLALQWDASGTILSGVGYAQWAGTSFAAPIVSGLASCLLQSGRVPTEVPGLIASSMSTGGTYGPVRFDDLSLSIDCAY